MDTEETQQHDGKEDVKGMVLSKQSQMLATYIKQNVY